MNMGYQQDHKVIHEREWGNSSAKVYTNATGKSTVHITLALFFW